MPVAYTGPLKVKSFSLKDLTGGHKIPTNVPYSDLNLDDLEEVSFADHLRMLGLGNSATLLA